MQNNPVPNNVKIPPYICALQLHQSLFGDDHDTVAIVIYTLTPNRHKSARCSDHPEKDLGLVCLTCEYLFCTSCDLNTTCNLSTLSNMIWDVIVT